VLKIAIALNILNEAALLPGVLCLMKRTETAYENTGAVEQDRPDQETNVAPLREQLDHRWQDPLNKQNDSGLAERGQNPEYTGEPESVNELEGDTKASCGDAAVSEASRADIRSKRMDVNADQNAQKPKPEPDDKNPEGETQDQDPGQRQKQNQCDKKDDDLAA
jgi:hypothetical protein